MPRALSVAGIPLKMAPVSRHPQTAPIHKLRLSPHVTLPSGNPAVPGAKSFLYAAGLLALETQAARSAAP